MRRCQGEWWWRMVKDDEGWWMIGCGCILVNEWMYAGWLWSYYSTVCKSVCPHGGYSEDYDDAKELHRNFCTEKPLRRGAFKRRSFYTKTFLNEGSSTHRGFLHRIFLHREVLTQRKFYTQKSLHRKQITQWSLYTHRHVYTEELEHRGTFA